MRWQNAQVKSIDGSAENVGIHGRLALEIGRTKKVVVHVARRSAPIEGKMTLRQYFQIC